MHVMESEITKIIGSPIVSIKAVSLASLAKYSAACDLAEAIEVYEVHSKDKVLHHIARLSDSSLHLLTGCCQVLYEDVPISQLVEYQFSEDVDSCIWRVASLIEDAVQTYKQSAFASWEEQLRKPSCEAAFRRLLQAGPVSKIFDKHIFPHTSRASFKVPGG